MPAARWSLRRAQQCSTHLARQSGAGLSSGHSSVWRAIRPSRTLRKVRAPTTTAPSLMVMSVTISARSARVRFIAKVQRPAAG
ncbi:hypothetical protein [Albidovulum sp.]|uniref:hypothetical protein n=1 Tax=Albidovulum sp. TaxID=1872424 RepID=UPI0039B8E4DA